MKNATTAKTTRVHARPLLALGAKMNLIQQLFGAALNAYGCALCGRIAEPEAVTHPAGSIPMSALRRALY